MPPSRLYHGGQPGCDSGSRCWGRRGVSLGLQPRLQSSNGLLHSLTLPQRGLALEEQMCKQPADSLCPTPAHRHRLGTKLSPAFGTQNCNLKTPFVSSTLTLWSKDPVTNKPVSMGYQVTPATVNLCPPGLFLPSLNNNCFCGRLALER